MGYPLWYGKEKCRLPEADAENPTGLSRCCLGICKAWGTCLIIDIRENDEIPQSTDALADTLTSWDLTAPWNGTVVSIITRMGMPQVKPGDVCKKGDILVSGSVAILDNDSQIQRYEYVRADADIVIKTQFPYYDEFPGGHCGILSRKEKAILFYILRNRYLLVSCPKIILKFIASERAD